MRRSRRRAYTLRALSVFTSTPRPANERTNQPPPPVLVTPFSGQDVIARSVKKMKTATKTRVSLRDIQCPGVHSIIPIHARLRAMANEPFCANHSVKYRRALRRILGAELSLKCSLVYVPRLSVFRRNRSPVGPRAFRIFRRTSSPFDVVYNQTTVTVESPSYTSQLPCNSKRRFDVYMNIRSSVYNFTKLALYITTFLQRGALIY